MAAARLEIQIATFGIDGLRRVVSCRHPRVEGVEWLISWQLPEGEAIIPEEMARRDDMRVVVSRDRGLARNRNHALDAGGESDYVLLSDDDVTYNPEALRRLVALFDSRPEIGLICVRSLVGGRYIKPYGEGEHSISKPPKGWYATTYEIAFRRSAAKGLRFNEHTGIGAPPLIAGEDSVWVRDMQLRGVRGIIFPLDLCSHPGESTGERLATSPDFIFTHGAVMTHLHPLSWLPRLIVHAMRSTAPTATYLRHCMAGVRYALSRRIFRSTR